MEKQYLIIFEIQNQWAMNTFFIKTALFLFFGLSIVACQQNTSAEQEAQQLQDTSKTQENFMLKDEAQNQVLKQYLNLKDALVASNATSAQQQAKSLAQILNDKAGFEQAAKSTDSIAQTSDLAQQRTIFTNLNNTLIPLLKKAELAKGAFYVQFCPMANEGNGGYWLAKEQEVRNPYYGGEMLNCGEVKETIK